MEELLKYFMNETNKRFDRLEQKVDDLGAFKVQTVVSARWVSFLVSSACGLVTMLVTLWFGGAFKK